MNNILLVIFFILWLITFIVWLLWLIGVPIYKKVIKKECFDWLIYALGLNIGALGLNLFNLLMKVVR